MTNSFSPAVLQETDTRTSAEFYGELCAIREKPLDAQLAFLRNRRNRDRAMSIPTDRLSRILVG